MCRFLGEKKDKECWLLVECGFTTFHLKETANHVLLSEEIINGQTWELICDSFKVTLNGLLEAEAEKQTKAAHLSTPTNTIDRNRTPFSGN